MRDTVIYTGSGLRRVKPYVQFGGIMWKRCTPLEEGVDDDVTYRALEGHPTPPYIGWRALVYKSVSIYPTRLQHEKLI
jgi:hypothetical protein